MAKNKIKKNNKFVVSKILLFFFFGKEYFEIRISTRLHLFDQKYSKNSNIVKY